MKDVFADMDAQLAAIKANSAEHFNSEEELIDTINRLSKTDLKEKKGLVESEVSTIKKVKVARKLDFSIVYSTDNRLDAWVVDMFGTWGSGYSAKHTTYRFGLDELRCIDLKSLVSEHDSYWCVDFMKAAINTVKEELTSFRRMNGRCERFIPYPKVIERHMIDMWHLNPEIAFDDQVIRFIGDMLKWMKEQESIGTPIEESESYMKEELLGMSLDELKELFEAGDDDIIDYHILHFNNPIEAGKLIRLTRLLVAEGKTPGDLELKKEDDWAAVINPYLGIEDEVVCEWDDELEEIEQKYDSAMYAELEAGRETRKEEVRCEKLSSVQLDNKKAAKAIVIEDKNGKRYEFESKGECMEFLGTTSATFCKFLKGESRLNNRFTVVNK